MNAKKGIVAAVVVTLVGLAAWWILRDQDPPATGIRASGTVEATEVHLGFELAGRIEAIDPREGDEVRRGSTLAWLDREELEAEIRGIEAGAEAARARLAELEEGPRPQELARAEAAARAARETRDEQSREAGRARRLFEGGAISRQDMERAQTAMYLAESALDQAREALELVREGPRTEQIAGQRARVRQAEAALSRARARMRSAAATAPFDGIVALRHREPGETVAPGLPVLTLRNLDDRWVRIYVAGGQVGHVRLGQLAEIRGDADPDRVYSGEVFFIGSEAEFTPRNVQTAEERVRLVYPVRVRITDDPEVNLKPGLPVDVVLSEGGGS